MKQLLVLLKTAVPEESSLLTVIKYGIFLIGVLHLRVKNHKGMKNCSVRKRLVIQRDTEGKILAVACIQLLL